MFDMCTDVRVCTLPMNAQQYSEAVLTDRQREVLHYIENYRAANGYSPALREIKEAMGFRSVTSAVQHVETLEDKGLVRVDRGVARAIIPIGGE